MWAAHEAEGQLNVAGINEEQYHGAIRSTYIQSPNLKLAFGLGGLLDSTNVPDSCCIGVTRSGSGENLEGGGKEMMGEFISRENGGVGEREKSGCDGRTLGTFEQRPAGGYIRTGRRSTWMSCSLANGWRSASRAGEKLEWRVAVGEQRASHA